MNKLLGLGHFEQSVRKSRFVAVCGPIQQAEDAADFVQTHGIKDCKHECWAYRAGPDYRFDDAGEPSGTAGRPILAAIDRQAQPAQRSNQSIQRRPGPAKPGTSLDHCGR